MHWVDIDASINFRDIGHVNYELKIMIIIVMIIIIVTIKRRRDLELMKLPPQKKKRGEAKQRKTFLVKINLYQKNQIAKKKKVSYFWR